MFMLHDQRWKAHSSLEESWKGYQYGQRMATCTVCTRTLPQRLGDWYNLSRTWLAMLWFLPDARLNLKNQWLWTIISCTFLAVMNKHNASILEKHRRKTIIFMHEEKYTGIEYIMMRYYFEPSIVFSSWQRVLLNSLDLLSLTAFVWLLF